MLAVVSADDPARTLEFARERLARWTWPAPRALDAPSMPALLAERPSHPALSTLVVHKPDSTQAQVRILSTGRTRAAPRYAESVLMNTALGGGFTSVLVDAIRVDRGLSYSVSSRLLNYRAAGLSIFTSFTKNETLRELVDVALDQMRRYAASGPTPDALEKCRVYLAGLFPLGIESREALAEACVDSILDGLGLQHIVTYRSRILAATLDGVRDAARDLSPAKPGAKLVVVGDAGVAQKALGDLGPVEVKQLEELA
jgi:zinc protease